MACAVFGQDPEVSSTRWHAPIEPRLAQTRQLILITDFTETTRQGLSLPLMEA